MKQFLIRIRSTSVQLVLWLLLLLGSTIEARSSGPVVGIIVDDDKPRVTMKMAEYVNDFLVYEVQVVTKTQYGTSGYGFAATVEVNQSGRGNSVSLSLIVRNGSSYASYGGGMKYNSSIPPLVTQNQQALEAALYVLENISTDSWKGLVELFEDPVEELEDME